MRKTVESQALREEKERYDRERRRYDRKEKGAIESML